MRPLIGITGKHCPPGTLVPKETFLYGSIGLNVLSDDMAGAVEAAGGIAVRLVPLSVPEGPAELISRLDGLLLPGGGDIDPVFYGETDNGRCALVRPELDRFEICLVRLAIERKLPVLGICRGAQLLNVATGGTLFQDMEDAGLRPHSLRGPDVFDLPRHPVCLTPEGGLAALYGRTGLAVNSLHHQAVRDIGPDTVIAARAEDGVTEAIHVLNGHPFTYGVQWHPELMPGSDVQTALFTAFINACRR